MQTSEQPAQQPPPLPLYLVSGKPLDAGIDGPALKISGPDEPVRRYPLTRLSRVIAGDAINWQGRAIARLLKNGIPMVLLSGEGGVCGYLLPTRHKTATLDQLIREFLYGQSWESRYRDWQRSIRMQLVESWMRRHTGRKRGAAWGRAPEQLVHETVYHIHSGDLPHERIINAAVNGVVVKILHEQGLAVSYPANGEGCLDLAYDLSDMVTYLLTLELFAQGHQIRCDGAALLRLLHHYAGRLEGKCNWMLGLLQRFLTEVLEEWL